jgi:hypothetical protein
VKYGERLVQLVIAAAFVWLFILILITISDYGSRPWPIAHTWRAEDSQLERPQWWASSPPAWDSLPRGTLMTRPTEDAALSAPERRRFEGSGKDRGRPCLRS